MDERPTPKRITISSVAVATWTLGRRIAVGIVGGVVVAAGLVMLVTPGPGVVAILLGLGILATEFTFARRWLKWMKMRAKQGVDRIRGHGGSEPKPPPDTSSQ